MTRMTAKQEAQRQAVEDTLFRMTRMSNDLELDALRVRQALRRHEGTSDLLRPVLEDLEVYRGLVESMRIVLAGVWKDAPWSERR